MAQLMIQRTDTQLALHGFKGRFDLCQLHIALPEHRGILTHEVRTEQIVAILQLRRYELCSVDAKLKAVARHRLAFARELQVQETKALPASFRAAPMRNNS